jgi:hypothetical protein
MSSIRFRSPRLTVNGAQKENAGIHLDDIEPPEHFDRLRDGTLDRRWIGAVGLEREAFCV